MIKVYKGEDASRVRDLIADEKRRTGFEDGTDDFDAQEDILNTLFGPDSGLPRNGDQAVLTSVSVPAGEWLYNLFTPDRFASLDSQTATIEVSGIKHGGVDLMVPGGSVALLITTFGGCNADSALPARILVIDFAEG
ncbi:hypothetical protein [Tabrizicola sp.]|uniref:hypothetical protein n=1 Tax=Tabrizicola sp. TaxID=2005166 RepID=UPI003F2DE792